MSHDMQNTIAYIQRLQSLNSIKSQAATSQAATSQAATSQAAISQAAISQAATSQAATSQAAISQVVRCYPDIALAAKKQGSGRAFQTWLVVSHLDQGQGDIAEDRLIDLTTAAGSVYRWSKPGISQANARRQARRRVNDAIKAGYLTRGTNGRLYRLAAAKVAILLGLDRIDTRPVDLPLEVVAGTAGQFNAAIYAAWLAGRNNPDKPISRDVIAAKTAVPDRTQRHYDKVAAVEVQPNIALAGRAGSVTASHDYVWQHGRASFEFTDYNGRHGPAGRIYLAHRLPNSYRTKLRDGHSGRYRSVKKRFNKTLSNPDNKGDRARLTPPVEKLYHDNGAGAARAYNRQPDTAVYWPVLEGAITQLWHKIG